MNKKALPQKRSNPLKCPKICTEFRDSALYYDIWGKFQGKLKLYPPPRSPPWLPLLKNLKNERFTLSTCGLKKIAPKNIVWEQKYWSRIKKTFFCLNWHLSTLWAANFVDPLCSKSRQKKELNKSSMTGVKLISEPITTRHLRITPPPSPKKGGRGVFNLFDFDSEKLPGFYSFQKPCSKLRWVFYLFKKKRPLRGRVFILGIFYKEIPTNHSIFSKISARFARGLLFIPKKIRALRARVFILFNFPKMTVGFYSFQFRFLKKPVRVLI